MRSGLSEHLLTREEQPQVPSHALRNPLEDELLRLLRAVHTHPLSELCEVVLPRLLLQELLRLNKQGEGDSWDAAAQVQLL